MKKPRIAFVAFSLKNLKYGIRTYADSVMLRLSDLGCMVKGYGPNPYPHSRLSPILSFLSAIMLVLKPWWLYDVVISNDGVGCFIPHPRKLTIVHHSAYEQMRRSGVNLSLSIGWLLQLISMKTSRGVLCISASTLDTIQRHLGNKKAGIVWNGLNHSVFRVLLGNWTRNLGLDDRPTIAYAGRLSKHKNFEALKILAELLEFPINLIVLGCTLPDDLKSGITSVPGVTLVNPGYVSQEEYVQYLNAADFFVNVSELEGFGLTQIEAMACGACVLAFDSDENRLILGDGGIIVNSLIEMASVLRTLSIDSEQRARLRAQGLSRAKHFDWMKTAQGILRFASTLSAESI